MSTSPKQNPISESLMQDLTLNKILSCIKQISPAFLNTPQLLSTITTQWTGKPCLMKLECLNPIRCFKGRGTELIVNNLPPNHIVSCASAGNFGIGLAWSAIQKNRKAIIFASQNANPAKLEMIRKLGAELKLVGADFDEAKTIARSTSIEKGWHFVEDGADIETLQGAASIAIELLPHLDDIDTILIPLGNGALAAGIGSIVAACKSSVDVVTVQSKGAPAMTDSLLQGRLVRHEKVNTIADGIAVRNPIEQVLPVIDGCIDQAILVHDVSIARAMKLIYNQIGQVVEPSAAVGLAAIIENQEIFKNRKTATILTGSNITRQNFRMLTDSI